MPKAYFIGGAYAGCNYVRCLLPQLHCGYLGSHVSAYSPMKGNNQIALEVMNSDILVIHRPDTPRHHRFAMEMRKRGKIIVFDNDDTAKLDEGHPFFGLNEYGKDQNQERYNNIINNFVRNADACTTTTEFLANEYRKLNKEVFVLHNCVDPDDWAEPLRNEGDKVRILISGSASYTQDFEIIAPYLRELDKRNDVQLILFGLWGREKRKENPLVESVYKSEHEFWDSLKNVEHVEWVGIDNYPYVLNDIKADIMLIPRKESYFNKAKSNLKFLEAAMCEIPVIAQSFSDGLSPYDKDLNGKNGLLATTLDDWKEKTELLIKDKRLRRSIGKEAKKYVLENFNIKTRYIEWEKVFNYLYDTYGSK